MGNKLQTVILAGGYGTRLYPLTEKLPKPLVRILSKPVIGLVLEKAEKLNPDVITITSMFMPDTLEREVRELSFENVDFVKESIPLGTAGAVKNAYDGESSEIVVLSGDGVFDFDLLSALEFHRKNKSPVTLVTTNCDEPCEYGVVVSDEKGRITQFCEKPSWGYVKSSRINTGVYILDKSVLSYIPDSQSFDFSKQLFPHLLRQNIPLFAYCTPSGSYWCDIGSLDELFSCSALAMENKIGGIVNDGYTLRELSNLGIDVENPVYVHKSVTFGKNIKLGKYTSLGENVTVSDDCTISEAIINQNCTVGKGSGVYGCMIGKNTHIGENCIIPEGCVLGGENSLSDGVMLRKNTRLKTGRKITEGNNMAATTRFKNAMFCDRGVFCGSGDISPEYFSKLGYALANVLSSSARDEGSVSVGVMTDGEQYSSVVGELVRAGLRAGGAGVYELGCGNEALAGFSAMTLVQNCVAFVYTASDSTIIKLINEDGLPVSRETEQRLEKIFREDKEFEKPSHIAPAHNFSSVESLYYASLMNSIRDINVKNGLSGFECGVIVRDGSESLSQNILKRSLEQYGAKVHKNEGDYLCIYLSPDGTNLYVRQGKTDADLYHVGAVLLHNHSVHEGSVLSLPEGSPDAYYRIAQNKNLPVSKINESSTDPYGRFVPSEQRLSSLWLRDGTFAALRLCFVLKSRENNLSGLLSEIPEFSVYTDELVGVSSRAKAMETLSKLDKSDKSSRRDGIRLVLADGTVTVIPGRVAGFKIISEATSFEAARELCRKIEDVMSGREKKK